MWFKNEYSFLSNLYKCKIEYEGKTFPCVETAFQYAKCDNDEDREKFIDVQGRFVTGEVAKVIGHEVKLRPGWNMLRLDVMYKLLEEKFYHNEKMRKALKDTGSIYIQEDNTCGDTFCGVCNGEGINMLGRMLMEIRENIKEEDRKVKRVIVAGSRTFNDYKLLCEKLDYYFKNITPIIVCGEAKGADALGKRYAEEHGYAIMSFPADWSKGKGAGYLRNIEMSKVGQLLVAFWDGKSKGTKHMIDVMKDLGKPVRIVRF